MNFQNLLRKLRDYVSWVGSVDTVTNLEYMSRLSFEMNYFPLEFADHLNKWLSFNFVFRISLSYSKVGFEFAFQTGETFNQIVLAKRYQRPRCYNEFLIFV